MWFNDQKTSTELIKKYKWKNHCSQTWYWYDPKPRQRPSGLESIAAGLELNCTLVWNYIL